MLLAYLSVLYELQAAALASMTAASPHSDAAFMARLHKVEKHIRTNKLRVTFTDQIGSVEASGNGDELNSSREAKRLAFYLFWNVRGDTDRCVKFGCLIV